MKAWLVYILFFLTAGSLFSFAQNAERKVWINPKDGMVFVPVPAGTLIVQVQDGATPDAELPFQEVIFNDFWMSSTEVTVAQFKKFAENTGYITKAEKEGNKWNWRNPGFIQKDDHPVVYISFEDAQAYVKWAEVDLPEESEWLYACYANTTTNYYWGDDLNSGLFWHRENSMEGTHRVAENQPNPWGLYDMIGNVKEYCKTIGGGFALPGESWIRCIRYKNREGVVVDQMVANSIKKLLHINSPNPMFVPFPWDDDRGFRCIYRK